MSAPKTLLVLALLVPLGTAPVLAQSMQDHVPGGDFLQNWDLDADGQVTLAEVAAKRGDIFAMIDADGSGSLDAAEFAEFDRMRADQHAAKGQGGNGPGDEMMSLAANDGNGDGSVSADEFAAQDAAFFAAMDRSGDGVLTGDDFGPGARGQGQGRMGQAGQGHDGAQHGAGQGRMAGAAHGDGQHGMGRGGEAPWWAFWRG